MTSLEIEPLVGAFGARVHNLDLKRDLDAAVVRALREAWLEHLVLIFPAQQLTPKEQIAAAATVGRPCENPFVAGLPDHPEVIPIVKEPDDVLSFGTGWHSDQTYEAVPPLGSLLYLKTVPARGGDTLWSSMYAAYEALSPAMQALLGGLVAEHDAGDSFGPKADFATRDADRHSMTIKVSAAAEVAVRHPVVCRHPETGRPMLFVNPVFTSRLVGFSEAESAALLDILYRHQQNPAFIFRHRWSAGDVALWDNRCTQHSALNDYHGQRRVAHRVTIAQERADWERVWDGRPIAA
ncbi:MAG: TauD/TfdA family dioxygenase [Rhodospirillales bacterium]